MTVSNPEWLTVSEAAAYLKVTRATLYRWVREGRLPLFKVGPRLSRLRFDDVASLVHPGDDAAWTDLATDAFSGDWDNEKDAAYDNWRELYGVRDR